jgi:hypothetical protein
VQGRANPVGERQPRISSTLGGIALRLHHIVLDTHDLPGLARRFWAQPLGWRILSEGEGEVIIGPDDAAPLGL